jgi:hypothetical protein
MEKALALRANRRSFDCSSRDETARGAAQDDSFYIVQSLNMSIHLRGVAGGDVSVQIRCDADGEGHHEVGVSSMASEGLSECVVDLQLEKLSDLKHTADNLFAN